MRMNNSIKIRLIIRPIVLTMVALALALLAIWLVPHQLSKVVSIIGGAEKQIELPPVLGYMLIFVFIVQPLSVLMYNLFLIKSWQDGKNPSCPACQFPMIYRVAKRGTFAGQRFWGCISFPRCRGTIHIG